MAIYLVRALPRGRTLPQLRRALDAGEIAAYEPFGRALQHSLEGARRAPDGWAVWEEVDFCEPPLAAERKAVLDHHFREISVERVSEGEGWRRVAAFPSLWDGVDAAS